VNLSTGTSVLVNSMAQLLAATGSQTITVGGVVQGGGATGFQCAGGTASVVSNARVEAFPKTFNNFNNASFSVNNCYGVGAYKYGSIQADGTYSIPGLTDGVWEVDVYPYFDNGAAPDVATSKTFVTVAGANVGANF